MTPAPPGGEAHEEDARRLDAHEVAKPDGGVVVHHDDGGVGEDTEQVIAQKADDARDEPSGVDADEGAHEVVDLTAHDQVRDVGEGHEAEEDERGADLLHRG